MPHEDKKEKPDFIVGLDNICAYGDFGKDAFNDLIKRGLPFAKIGNKIAVDKKILNDFVRSLIVKGDNLNPSEMPPE